MPVIAPAELWQTSGRYPIPELWKTEDRMGRPFVLAMTHEETITFHAREISSYRQLPQILYHFQTKVRDEPRPRGGLIRVREFIMKDSYSFDRDEEGLEVSFRKHERRLPPDLPALRARVLRRAGGVRDDGRQRVRRLPRPVGVWREHARHLRERGLRSRPRGRAGDPARRPSSRSASTRPTRWRRPEPRPSRRLAELLGIDPAATSKAMPVVKDDGTVVLALVRGDDRLEEAKTGSRPRRRLPARPRRRRSARRSAPIPARSARSGSAARSSPTRRCVRASSSWAPTGRAGTCAASSTGATSRPASPTSASRGRATRARSAAGGSLPDRDRGRPHLQARHPLLGAARREVPRRGRCRSARSSWAPTASGRPGSWPQPSSRTTTSTASPGRGRSPRTRSSVVAIGAAGPEAVEIAERVAGTSRRRGSRCCSTTATCARARSSPMPT